MTCLRQHAQALTGCGLGCAGAAIPAEAVQPPAAGPGRLCAAACCCCGSLRAGGRPRRLGQHGQPAAGTAPCAQAAGAGRAASGASRALLISFKALPAAQLAVSCRSAGQSSQGSSCMALQRLLATTAEAADAVAMCECGDDVFCLSALAEHQEP